MIKWGIKKRDVFSLISLSLQPLEEIKFLLSEPNGRAPTKGRPSAG
jgi:hypothetical protein